jgi:ABC-type sugar transport system ATPase subunit
VENVYLGLDYEKKGKVAVDWVKMKKRVESLMDELGIKVRLDVPLLRSPLLSAHCWRLFAP